MEAKSTTPTESQEAPATETTSTRKPRQKALTYSDHALCLERETGDDYSADEKFDDVVSLIKICRDGIKQSEETLSILRSDLKTARKIQLELSAQLIADDE